MLFGFYLARSVGRPVRSVADGASRLAGGEWSLRLPPQGPGEIGELTRSFNEMADQLEQNRAELEQQNAELRESERMKTELVNIVSHELRTPLASVLGFTALLLKREFDPPARRHYLGIVDAQARRLAALLEDFLDVQRIEHQGLELVAESDRPGRAPRRAGAALRRAEPEAPARGGARGAAAARARRRRTGWRRWSATCSRMRSNTPRRGAWSSWRRCGTNGEVRLSVRDEGLGIPSDQQERIFTKFFRGDAGATGITGTGLGLAVSREIVEAHGGRIGFDSDPGERIDVLGRAARGARRRGRTTKRRGAT